MNLRLEIILRTLPNFLAENEFGCVRRPCYVSVNFPRFLDAAKLDQFTGQVRVDGNVIRACRDGVSTNLDTQLPITILRASEVDNRQ